MTKVVNESIVYVGDVVRFNITVNNTGSANATGVNITDSLNSAFEFVNASGNVKADVNNVVVWNNLKIVNGTSVTVWVEVRVKTNGTFTNVAVAKANENTTTFENETDVTVKPVVNLTVVKSSDVVGNASVGDLVNYTITVTNNGPSNATMVNITDKLDSSFEYINSTGNIRPVNGVITWNISKIVNGTSVSVWVQVRVTTNGTFTNVAVAKAKENNTEFNNETNITVKPVTNLDIIKSSNASYGKNASVGDFVEFNITVINRGPSNATNINITDVLNPAFEFHNATGNYTRNNQNIVWNIGKLNKGENVTVHLIAVAKNNGYYENVAVVNSTENPTGNSSKTIVVIEPAVNITMIKKSNLTDNAHVGDLVNFTIEITNNGPSKATDVNITDSLPNGLVYVDSGNNITGNKGQYSKINGIESIEWNIGNLTKGSKALVWVIVNVTTNGTFTNVAGVTSNENKTGTSNETNITVDPVVNLTVVKYSNVIGNVSVGDLVNFTIVVTNYGPSNATMVNITDELNSAFEFVNASGNVRADENNVVKWIIPKIVSGNSTSVWVQVRVKANGTFTNVAVVKSRENSTPSENRTNISADPIVNLVVNKTVNATNVIVGDLVEFTINVTNNGPSNATLVNITDRLDSAFEFIAELNPGVTYANGVVSWTINKINVNETASVVLKVRVVKEGNFSNVASVVSHENDTVTNGSSENVTAGTVILNVTKIGNASIVNVGDVVRFNITVNNTGSANATGVNVTDVLNPAFEFVNASGNVKADVNNVVVWNNLNIVNGTSVTLWVEVRVKTNGTFTNVAAAKANENTTTFENETDVTVKPVVNLTVVKTSDVVGNASVGDLVNYTITVTNNGPGNATMVNITDKLDSSFEYINSTGNVRPVNGVITWNITKIVNGTSVSVWVQVRVTANGTFTNVAVAKAKENDTEFNNETNITVNPVVNLAVNKTVNATNVIVGDLVEFTINVTNNGPSNATLVNITDRLDSAFEFIGDLNPGVTYANGVVSWTIDRINVNETASVVLVVRVVKEGNFSNVASVVSRENDTVTNGSSENVTAGTVILNVTKIGNESIVNVGDVVRFNITVNNTGSANATGVNITDSLNSAFEFVNASGNVKANSSNVVVWKNLKIVNGTSVTVWVEVRVKTNGTFTNVATAKANENKTAFENETNITVNPVVNLTVVKSSDVVGNVSVGDLVNYTITVTNNGPSNATMVNITDELNSAFEFVNASGNAKADENNVVKWIIPKIVSGNSTSVWVQVRVKANGTFTNLAVVESRENSTPSENGTNITVDPVVNLAVNKTVNATNVIVGDLVKFIINVTNNGPSDATLVNITDRLDSAFEFIAELNPGVTYANGVVSWNIKKINVNETASVELVVRVVKEGNFSNVASVVSHENDTVTNGSSENVTAGTVILNVTKIANESIVNVGDVVRFDIVVNNTGSANATGVNVTDVLNSVFEFVNASGDVKADVNNVVVWSNLNIVNGSSVTVWVEVRVKANGTFTNVATAVANENKTTFENETNITVDPVVNLSVNKTVNATNVIVGDLVKFTINVTNNGPSNATMVNITDRLDSAFEFIDNLNPDASYANGVVSWTINKINVNETASVVLTVRVVKEGNFSNVASVVSHENDAETNGSSENVTAGTVILNITKSANASVVNVGDVVRFDIVVNNTGSANATGVNVTDVLNSVFEFVNASGDVKADVNNVVVWSNLNIVNGSSVTVWVEVRVKANGTFTNVASAVANENKTTFENGTNITVNPVVNLAVNKTVNATNVTVGDLVKFTINVTNNGPSNATGVNITDKLDSAFEFIAELNPGVNYANGVVSWTINKINVNGTASVELTVRVVKEGNFSNVAFAKSNENDTETNGSSENVTVNKAPSFVSAEDVNVTYGEAIIIPVVSENATGVIYQIINTEGKVVANGTIGIGENITGLDLPAGDYVVNLTTMVDANHTVANNASKLTVNKAIPPMDITPVNITYGDNETIIIELPENATGTVNITVGNKTFVDIPVENGTVNITVPDLPAGNYTVDVTYSGNENYTSTNGSEPFNVKKVDTPIDLDTQNIFYGDVEVIVVTLPEDVTGTVNITVGDKTYENVPVNNGKAELPIDDLGGGTYPVEVVYGGDNNHNGNSTTGSFVVSPVKPIITIEVEDIWVGEVEILNITVNAPGSVNITVNGITVTVSLENGVVTTDVLAVGIHEDYNGRATWNIINLPVGLYPAFTIYGGNENYTSVNTSDVFRVRALPTSLDITTHDIYVGEDESIQVLVNYTDAKGNITITVDGRNYTSPVENGKAQFTVPGLKAGEYDVEAYYSGDDKYLPSNATGEFKVSKFTPTINTEAPDIKVGEDGVITVTVPSDATGTITIVVEGKEYTATIDNGKAIFVVPGLSEGTHEIKVYYSGDDKYNPIDGIGSIRVLPLDKNKTSPDAIPSKGVDLTSYPTGNPILVMLLVMMLIGSTAIRRFKK
ncbi:Ig-like domain repeat protein [Methanobrevibacter sp.]|uniref:Ig-like domain repeat protein n=1 Tax=Methanobrevibacter sp. TaxID=66852 RepID=UPI00388E2AC4